MRKMKIAFMRRIAFVVSPFYKKFGKMSCIYKPLMINGRKYISIGKYCNISEGARLEAISKWGNQNLNPSIEIGDNTSIENFLHLIAAGKVQIGHNCVFSSRVMITSIDHDYLFIGKKVHEQDLIVSDVKIGNYCFIGMDVKVFPGVTIGDNVIVGANSIVMNDIPSYSVCVGVPAKVIKKYNFHTKQWEKV